MQRVIATILIGLLAPASALPQEAFTFKSAVVALTDDPVLRAEFEDGLVAKAREHDYDAVTSHDLVPNIEDVGDRRFPATLASHGVRMVLMVRPAAVGPGASLESVREAVSPQLFESMRRFARETSNVDADELIAVVHLGIYALTDGDATLVSPGAVWLDHEVTTRSEGIERLQDLIVVNVNAVRPAIREHLGMPPLE